MPLCCDFCTDGESCIRYHAKQFGVTTDSQVFGDTPIYSIEGLPHVATEDLHPSYGIGAMLSQEWLSCRDCARLIDARNLEGLVARCIAQINEQPGIPGMPSRQEAEPLYRQLFMAFFHYVRKREPWPR